MSRKYHGRNGNFFEDDIEELIDDIFLYKTSITKEQKILQFLEGVNSVIQIDKESTSRPLRIATRQALEVFKEELNRYRNKEQ